MQVQVRVILIIHRARLIIGQIDAQLRANKDIYEA